jgi:hypothetical protein
MPRPSNAKTAACSQRCVQVVLAAAATDRTLSYPTTDASGDARDRSLTYVVTSVVDGYAPIAGLSCGRVRHAGHSESQSTEAGQTKNRPCKALYILAHYHQLSPWLIVAFFRAQQTLKSWICHARNFSFRREGCTTNRIEGWIKCRVWSFRSLTTTMSGTSGLILCGERPYPRLLVIDKSEIAVPEFVDELS